MKRKRGRKQTLEKRNETKILLYIVDADWYCFYQCCGSGSGAGSTGFTFFEPPGSRSGSISQRYGSGSIFFYQQAKNLKTDVNLSSKRINTKTWFFVSFWKVDNEIEGSGFGSEYISHRQESADPHQNVLDLQHWYYVDPDPNYQFNINLDLPNPYPSQHFTYDADLEFTKTPNNMYTSLIFKYPIKNSTDNRKRKFIQIFRINLKT